MHEMAKGITHFLVLIACLPLVLPVGWCCSVLSLLGKPSPTQLKTVNSTPARPLCSSCCKKATLLESLAEAEQQPAAPHTPPVPQCPCAEREATTAPVSTWIAEQIECGFKTVGISCFIAPCPPLASGARMAVPTVHPCSCPLHIRNCVWRC
jgi:hypothetical protein